jgi:hypothetical protein
MIKRQILNLLHTYANLSDKDGELVLELIDKLANARDSEKTSIHNIVTEDLRKGFSTDSVINFAPVPGVCPRCGK